MKNMRFLAIGSAYLVICLGICSCSQRQEQARKPGSMKMTVSSTMTGTYSCNPLESAPTASELRVENVKIETDTLTCTADTAQFNRETGQMILTGNVVIRTADGIEFTAEEVFLKGKEQDT